MDLKRIIRAVLPVLTVTALFAGCTLSDGERGDSHYAALKAFIDSIKVIDTHEHQRPWPLPGQGEANFYTILNTAYLKADLVSAGAPPLHAGLTSSVGLDSLWTLYGPYLDQCRNTSYYGHLVEGFRLLYGLREPYFTRSNIEELSRRIRQNYSDPVRWRREAFGKASFELMLNDQWWDQLRTETDFEGHALVMRIDQYLVSIAERSLLRSDAADTLSNPFHRAGREGIELESLDDFLSFARTWFLRFAERGAVCAKTANAYHRSIDYAVVSRGEAEKLFARPSESLSPTDKKALQDFMFRWCVSLCDSLGLPLQIHTGYLAGNSRDLENGHPMKLLEIFQSFPQQRFSLFHGGYPWFQDIGAIGKNYPNVTLDLVWLPQISRESAESALGQWLDAVPYSKIFWGGDCATIEEATGSLEYGRQAVAGVLAERIGRGDMSPELARTIAKGILRENAVRWFSLEEKLGRQFN